MSATRFLNAAGDHPRRCLGIETVTDTASLDGQADDVPSADAERLARFPSIPLTTLDEVIRRELAPVAQAASAPSIG